VARTWPVRSQTQFPGQLNTRLIYDGHENNWVGGWAAGTGTIMTCGAEFDQRKHK